MKLANVAATGARELLRWMADWAAPLRAPLPASPSVATQLQMRESRYLLVVARMEGGL